MTPAIKTVVFDMDGVLCDYHVPTRIRALAQATGIADQAIIDGIWHSGFEQAGDEGRYGAEEYLAGFFRAIGAPVDRALWIAARKAAMTPWSHMLVLARRVALRVPVAMLTNNGPLLKETLPDIFPDVVDIFGPRAFCSSEFGAAKPAARVFWGLLDRLGRQPGEVLFIDDLEENVAGAEAVGIGAHRFTNEASLCRWLAEHGLP
ncbi:MAG: HAD family phosphatase [Alphaproteobacteria bacterium]|nr:HAD family phosphatase [Alphaproteobacteria bacterium]